MQAGKCFLVLGLDCCSYTSDQKDSKLQASTYHISTESLVQSQKDCIRKSTVIFKIDCFFKKDIITRTGEMIQKLRAQAALSGDQV